MANILKFGGGSDFNVLTYFMTENFVFSKTAGDTATASGRSCIRNSSEKAIWTNLKINNSYYGWACFSKTLLGAELTNTSSYGDSTKTTFTTTNGEKLYCSYMASAWNGSGTVVIVANGVSKAIYTTGNSVAVGVSIPQSAIDEIYNVL